MTRLKTELSALRLIAVSLLYAIPAFLLARWLWQLLGLWLFPLQFVIVLGYMWWQGQGHKAHNGK